MIDRRVPRAGGPARGAGGRKAASWRRTTEAGAGYPAERSRKRLERGGKIEWGRHPELLLLAAGSGARTLPGISPPWERSHARTIRTRAPLTRSALFTRGSAS